MSTNTKRIQLLSDAEIEDLYSLPLFNQEERRYYFNLDKQELKALRLYKNIKTRLYFILQLGYFKATQQFYNFNFEDVKADVRFISQTYFQNNLQDLEGKVSRNHNQKQKEDILKLFGYRSWSESHKPQVESHLCELIRTYPKIHNAFRELLVYFGAQKIVLPSYRILQDIFTQVLRLEQKRINDLVLLFPKHLQEQLINLIHNEDGLLQLNLMRADQKDFQYTALRLEIEKAQKLSELYLFCKEYIPKLKLSKNSIRYYAGLVEQYAPTRLIRLTTTQRLLHLICFVYHRYQQFMDNMITTFMYHVRAILNAEKLHTDKAFLEHSSKLVVDFPKLARFLKWFPSQEKNPEITYAEFSQAAYTILPKQQFEPLAKFIAGNSFDKRASQWKFYGQSSRILALYLRPILLTVDFEFYIKDSSIMELVHLLKTHYSFGYSKIPIYCGDYLDDMLKKLDNAWDTTLQAIDFKKNNGIQLKQKNGQLDWALLYDATPQKKDVFFKNLPHVEISNIVKYVGDLTGMWESFSHSKDRYVKRRIPPSTALNACILAQAFGVGTQKMSEMSDLNFGLLRSTTKDFINVENLCYANDVVSNYIYSLPIFKLWNLLDNKLLADADGQKYSTSNHTIQSRYSKKYLGKGKGISLYTLLANFVAANARNLGLNEYEGHFLYDIVYGNKTDIPIDMVTGDNHSLNQLNFVVLDSINVNYVPSIKNIKQAAEELYSVKSPESYIGFIQPKRQINVSRIRSQERSILRVLISLLIQENTQSTIIRKLNSHARYAKLRAALFEYNNIFKSIHVLNLINDMKMRKSIRTARNRTEAYHQFQSHIRKVYHRAFRGKKIVDNQTSTQASRLVANCCVAYNATILNGLYEKILQSEASPELIDRLARISPIAWTHISFTGKYNFRKSDGQIDFEEIVSLLEKQVQMNFSI